MLNDYNTDRSVRRAFNFDLNQEQLSEHYPLSNPMAYKEIKEFFLGKNFEHIQGSGYVSKNPLNRWQVIEVDESLFRAFSWLRKCVKGVLITDISNISDGVEIFDSIERSDIETLLSLEPVTASTPKVKSTNPSIKQDTLNTVENPPSLP